MFRYIGTSTTEGEFRKTTNWQAVSSSDPACGTGTARLCEHTAIDAADLANQLNGKSNADVLLLVDETKP